MLHEYLKVFTFFFIFPPILTVHVSILSSCPVAVFIMYLTRMLLFLCWCDTVYTVSHIIVLELSWIVPGAGGGGGFQLRYKVCVAFCRSVGAQLLPRRISFVISACCLNISSSFFLNVSYTYPAFLCKGFNSSLQERSVNSLYYILAEEWLAFRYYHIILFFCHPICLQYFFLVVFFYILRFSRFSVEVCNVLLITLRDTPQSVGLLWTRDRLVAEASTWQQHTTLTRDKHPCPPV
jgi:hypothetical protein